LQNRHHIISKSCCQFGLSTSIATWHWPMTAHSCAFHLVYCPLIPPLLLFNESTRMFALIVRSSWKQVASGIRVFLKWCVTWSMSTA
jgi:hypothetical protein